MLPLRWPLHSAVRCQRFTLFFNSEGIAGTGGRGKVAVISVEAGLGLRGTRDTQVFSQRTLRRALLEPSSRFLFAKLHFQEVSDIENLFQMPRQATKGKKNNGREEGRWGTWGKRERGKRSSSKKKVVVPTWLFLLKIIS